MSFMPNLTTQFNSSKYLATLLCGFTLLSGCGAQDLTYSREPIITTIAGSNLEAKSVDGVGSNARFNNPGNIVNDGTNLYVVDSGNHTLRKIVIASKTVTTHVGLAGQYYPTDGIGADARLHSPAALAINGDDLYVMDSFTSYPLREINISTRQLSTINTTLGSMAIYGMATDGTDLYTTSVTWGQMQVIKVNIASGIKTVIAGQGAFGSQDGTGLAAAFYNPTGIVINGADLYVVDQSNFTIRKVVISTGEVTTFAGTAGNCGSDDGIGAAASFCYPNAITTDGTNLYVGDGTSTIRKIEISTGLVTTIAGLADEYGYDDGVGPDARFGWIGGMTTDGTNLYLTDDNNTIRKLALTTGQVTTIAGSNIDSESMYGTTDGTKQNAKFSNASGIAYSDTDLYITDQESHTIRKVVISTGAVTTFAGSAENSGAVDDFGTDALFDEPSDIVRVGDNLYVTDKNNHTIRKISIATREVTTFAGDIGVSGSTDGIGTSASFDNPYKIASDGSNLYVVDSYNYTIRKIVIATKQVTTLAGTAGNWGHTNGIGPAAAFHEIYGITTDGTNLYVTDDEIISKIVIATGEVTTLAGAVGSRGTTDGIGAGATFFDPKGITNDGTNLYVNDLNIIRAINIETGAVTTFAGKRGEISTTDGPLSTARVVEPNAILYTDKGLFFTQDYCVRRIK